MLLQNVRINHRRGEFLVSEQFLYRANIIADLKQMRSKRMPECVRAGIFWNPTFSQRILKYFLQTRRRNVMSARCARARIFAQTL